MSNIPTLTKNLSVVKRQRNLAIVFCAVFALSTGASAALGLSKKDRIITIPTTVDSYVIEKGRVSDNYLISMTRDASNLFLNRHPYDSDYFETNVLRIVHPSTHETIKNVLREDDENNQYRSGIRNWLPKNICILRNQNISEVSGTVQTYVNGALVVEREVKQYFKWQLDGTRLWLVSSGEIAEGEELCL
ncbi:MAG: TraE/TraK family type IV conjugative transfer system protein [Maricaulaceae bacterium]